VCVCKEGVSQRPVMLAYMLAQVAKETLTANDAGRAPAHPERLAEAVGVHVAGDVLDVVAAQVGRDPARVLHHLCMREANYMPH